MFPPPPAVLLWLVEDVRGGATGGIFLLRSEFDDWWSGEGAATATGLRLAARVVIEALKACCDEFGELAKCDAPLPLPLPLRDREGRLDEEGDAVFCEWAL